mgnify:CR=1 FL=1
MSTNLYSKRHKLKESWFFHCRFGIAVGLRLLLTALAFSINAVLPFVPVPKSLDLRNTSNWAGRINFTREQDRRRYAKI